MSPPPTDSEIAGHPSVALAPTSTAFTDVFVAIHGIGEQSRNETIKAVATQLSRATELGAFWLRPPVSPQPLGHFQGSNRFATTVIPLEFAGSPAAGGAEVSIGLAEVYWADIPRGVVEENRTLEETKAWARTVVARAGELYRRAFEAHAATADRAEEDDGVGQRLQRAIERLDYYLSKPDFALAGEVLDQMIETIYVIENIVFLARKAGLVSLDLTGLLNNFLGDVQLVTEFASYRLDIVGRFYQTLENIHEQQKALGNPGVRIHVIAHSEGTVVSFLGLLYAMSGQRVRFPEGGGVARVDRSGTVPEWLATVRSYMTIGSPIDKHLLLWEHLWGDFAPCPGLHRVRIRWRNYYDLGDPVGFRLDTARAWLKQNGFDAFEFTAEHDIGFARYLVPGKAHVDYWADSEVFGHFLTTAVFPKDETTTTGKTGLQLEPQPAPGSRAWVHWLSPALPYLLSFCVLMVGVFVAGKVLADEALPSLSPSDAALVRQELGMAPPSWDLITVNNVLGVTLLIAGVTLLARLPRLSAGLCWKVVGAVMFVGGLLTYVFWVDYSIQREVGYLFSVWPAMAVVVAIFWLAIGALDRAYHKWAVLGAIASAAAAYVWRDHLHPMTPENEFAISLGGTSLLALTVALAGLAVTRRSKDRQKRWLLRGMRPLILLGALVIAAIVGKEFLPIPLEEVEGRKHVTFEKFKQGDVWRVRNVRVPESVEEPSQRMAEQAKYDIWWDLQVVAELVPPPEGRDVGVSSGPKDQTVLDEKLWRLAPIIMAYPPLWRVVVASLAMLYLWWLSALLFDLSFVWHCYVRKAGVDERLKRWSKTAKR